MEMFRDIKPYRDFLEQYYSLISWEDILSKVPFKRTYIEKYARSIQLFRPTHKGTRRKYIVSLLHDKEIMKTTVVDSKRKRKIIMDKYAAIPIQLKDNQTFNGEWSITVSPI